MGGAPQSAAGAATRLVRAPGRARQQTDNPLRGYVRLGRLDDEDHVADRLEADKDEVARLESPTRISTCAAASVVHAVVAVSRSRVAPAMRGTRRSASHATAGSST